MVAATSELTITHPTKGTLKVMILDDGIKHAWDKMLQLIPVPGKTDAQGLPLVWAVDLQRIQEQIQVTQGVLLDEQGDTMWQKKAKLRSIINAKGTMSIKWNDNDLQQPYTVNITKAGCGEKVGSFEDSTESEFIPVTIVFTICQHKG